MKSDSQILNDVRDELKWDPQVAESEIALAVREGVVTLSGNVESFAQKLAAERAAERVGGVRVVATELAVKVPKPFEQTDTEIAHRVSNALAWHSEIPREQIKARVERGWVWLEGVADWQYQRVAAESAVRYLIGVKGVTNLVSIAARPSTYDVSKRIKEALHRSAESDSRRIEVETAGGRVTLKGTVRTFAERDDAERAAWAASGVTDVDDRIVIGV